MSGPTVSPSAVIADAVSNLEKKQRNLLKRKAKLESYRDVLRKGGSLTADQEKAVSEYDSVCQLVESLKETTDVINEIQRKVADAVKENEVRLLSQRDDYAINVYRKVCPLLDLMAKSQLPKVKDAILKASDAKSFKLLEAASKALTIRLPPSFKVECLDSSNWFQQPAEFLFKLADGVDEAVTGKSGKSRSGSFAELRQYCYELLTKEEVRAALASPIQQPNVAVAPTEHQNQAAVPHPAKPTNTNNHVESVKTNGKSAPPATTPLQSDAILISVINPLKTNFNFVQESHVGTLPTCDSVEPSIMHGYQHTLSTQPQQQNEPHAAPADLAHATVAPVAVPVIETVPGLSTTEVTRSEMASAAKPIETQAPPPPAEVPDKPKVKQAKISNVSTQQEKPPQPPSFQAVMDSELAMHEANKQVPTQPLTWADRVRGAPPQPPLTPTSAVPNGHRPQQQQPHPKSRQPREPREHRPPRPSFNKEGVENNGTRSGPPRGGFRGNGRGRGNGGTPLRGGRGRGGQRGSFHPRGGFDGQQATPRQPAGPTAA
ncbi:hypothetical protein Aperf_G00000069140 [Anoplocephala perfoliata]